LTLDGDEWSASRPDRLIPRERATGTHWMGGCSKPMSTENFKFKNFLSVLQTSNEFGQILNVELDELTAYFSNHNHVHNISTNRSPRLISALV
jgi:hypothetical protein